MKSELIIFAVLIALLIIGCFLTYADILFGPAS